jgi:hypothetical protein
MSRHDAGVVPVPKLTSRQGTLWITGTALALVGVVGYLTWTQPENRWTLAVIVPVLALLVAWAAGQRCWLDRSSGTVVWQRFWVSRRTQRLADVASVELRPNGQHLLLQLRDSDSGRRRYLTLLALTDYVQRSQEPELLEILAEDVAAHCPRGAVGDVPAQLRRQAAHLRAGGEAKSSPLASRVTGGMINVVKGGGAVGGGSGLLS